MHGLEYSPNALRNKSGKDSMFEENYFLFCYLHSWFNREIEKGDIQVHSTRVKDCLI